MRSSRFKPSEHPANSMTPSVKSGCAGSSCASKVKRGVMLAIGERCGVILLLWGLTVSSAQAQSYSIDWFTVDGGGGTSAGGAYSVRGTVGQPDAGPVLSGGSFAVTGGFWALVEVIQTPGAPLLKIRREGPNVVISWPNPSTGFILQQTTQLDSPPIAMVWTDVALVPTENGLEKSVTTPSSPGHRFFRLKRL